MLHLTVTGRHAMFTDDDRRFMCRALELADTAKGRTFPNPAVGAVIVKGDTVVGKGATGRAGGPHAEKTALEQAGARARGAVLYLTLEPCCHHGRTPPCTDAIVNAGIARVVAATGDPNPLVAGKGFGELREAGIDVAAGLCEKEARRINEDFLYAIVNKRAWVTLKLALTWDGRIADTHGESRWITSEETRRFAHDLRRRHAGVAVGRGTVRKDDPELTVRHVKGPSPVRFVFASMARIPPRSKLARTAISMRTVVVIPGGGSPRIGRTTSGLEVWQTGAVNEKQSMRRFVRMAYDEGLTSVLFEGGRRLASFLMEYRFVNRLYLCYGNKILGGGLEGLAYRRPLRMVRAAALSDVETLRFGDDVVVTGIPSWR